MSRFGRNISCNASDWACSHTFIRSVVCRASHSCTPLKHAFGGFGWHLPGSLHSCRSMEHCARWDSWLHTLRFTNSSFDKKCGYFENGSVFDLIFWRFIINTDWGNTIYLFAVTHEPMTKMTKTTTTTTTTRPPTTSTKLAASTTSTAAAVVLPNWPLSTVAGPVISTQSTTAKTSPAQNSTPKQSSGPDLTGNISLLIYGMPIKYELSHF